MCLYVTRMYSYVFVCYSYVLVWCFIHGAQVLTFLQNGHEGKVIRTVNKS